MSKFSFTFLIPVIHYKIHKFLILFTKKVRKMRKVKQISNIYYR